LFTREGSRSVSREVYRSVSREESKFLARERSRIRIHNELKGRIRIHKHQVSWKKKAVKIPLFLQKD